jgi:hypothetical protein
MPDTRLINLMQRFPTTTVWQGTSPANAHYEMLAFLTALVPSTFAAREISRSWWVGPLQV